MEKIKQLIEAIKKGEDIDLEFNIDLKIVIPIIIFIVYAIYKFAKLS